MTDQQQTDTTTQNIAEAIQEVSERASMLVREEIELAKVEVTEKVTKLVRGAVVGIAAGIFVVFGPDLPPARLRVAGVVRAVPGPAVLLGLLRRGRGAPAARRAGGLHRGACLQVRPRRPLPQMAIDEAKRIKETVQSSQPEQTI